jgi:hypothetical protein
LRPIFFRTVAALYFSIAQGLIPPPHPVFFSQARTAAAPWSSLAQGQRLSAQVDLLFSRHSSEDLLYALFFVLHARALEIKLVRHTLNPTWEKGVNGAPRTVTR